MQGIYKIENIKNNKKYIGSSKNIEKRFRDHKKNLETGKHHSIKLQRAWNKTKNKNIFSFEVIEEVKDIKNLKKREQYYIDLYDAYYNGYNCSLKVDNPSYTKRNVDKMDRKDDIPRLQKEFVSLYDAICTYVHYCYIGKTKRVKLWSVGDIQRILPNILLEWKTGKL